MKRPHRPVPARKPAVKTHAGHNWKFFAHLCIIAGLVYAISIAWQNLGDAQAKREAENRKAAAERTKAHEKAWAEARRKAAERDTPTLPEPRSVNEPAPAGRPINSQQRQQEPMLTEDASEPVQQNDRPKPFRADSAENDPGPEFAALTARARELVIAAERKRGERFAENTRTLAWNLDVWLRGLNKSEQAAWNPHVAQIKAATSDGRVPESILDSRDIQLSDKMAQLARDAVTKQSRIDLEYLSDTEKIHRAYLGKIKDAITQAESSGQSGTAAALGRAVEYAANLDSWIQSLGVDRQPAADAARLK